MKRIIFLVLSLSCLSAQSESYKITNISTTDREAVFDLSSYPHVNVQLDCSSFLHGVHVTDGIEKKFFYLYESECYEVFSHLKTWINAGDLACLKLDFEQKDWSLEKGADACP